MLPSYLFNFNSLLDPHNVLIILIILFVCDRLKDVSSIFVRHLKHELFYNIFLRIQLKLNTALLSTVRPSVCLCVTGVTSHISHIYKGINAMLIIKGPIKP